MDTYNMQYSHISPFQAKLRGKKQMDLLLMWLPGRLGGSLHVQDLLLLLMLTRVPGHTSSKNMLVSFFLVAIAQRIGMFPSGCQTAARE